MSYIAIAAATIGTLSITAPVANDCVILPVAVLIRTSAPGADVHTLAPNPQ